MELICISLRDTTLFILFLKFNFFEVHEFNKNYFLILFSNELSTFNITYIYIVHVFND